MILMLPKNRSRNHKLHCTIEYMLQHLLLCARVKAPCLPSLLSFGIGMDGAAADRGSSDTHHACVVSFKAEMGKSEFARASFVVNQTWIA